MELTRKGGSAAIEVAGISGSVTDPDIVQLNSGKLLAVWTETTGQPTDEFDDTDGGIFARLLTKQGRPDGDVIQINDWSPFLQDTPHVVATSDGGFAIGWTSNATYGETVTDPDVFLRVYDEDANPVTIDPTDAVADNPDTAGQSLVNLVELSSGRIGAMLESGNMMVFSRLGEVSALLQYQPVEGAGASEGFADAIQLNNGNILTAVAAQNLEVPEDSVISFSLTDSFFVGPRGIPGVYAPLRFDTLGATEETIGELNLVKLKGGGFAVSYEESRGEEASVVRLEFYTEYGTRTARSDTLLSMGLDNPLVKHDLLALEGGGVALAVVSAPGDESGTDVDVLLFDEDGALQSEIKGLKGSQDGNQGAPALTQLGDGRIALLFSDDSGKPADGEVSPLVLSFFDVKEPYSKLVGTDGKDTLGGVGGDDKISGLDGNDRISGRNGADTLNGGAGNDTLFGGNGHDGLRGGLGNDRLFGGDGNDGLGGGAGKDRLDGGKGNDILGGGGGNDRLKGGEGNDLLKGAAGNDTLMGQDGSDVLKGGGGNDVLSGGSGSDRLIGSAGSDKLTGGDDADVFVFRSGESGEDRIMDFDASEDSIELAGVSESDVSVSRGGGNTVIEAGDITVTLVGVRLSEGDISFDFV